MKFLIPPIILACLCASAVSQAEPNLVKGAALFQQCSACHTVGDGAEHTVGPHLNHVFGRRAAGEPGFEYSDAMRAQGETEQLIWSEKSVYIFLAGPERYIPGTRMAFKGLRREREIKDLIAWLLQYSPAYQQGSGEEVTASAAAAATLPPPPTVQDPDEQPDLGAESLTSAEAIASGADLWVKQCRHCHGSSAYPGKAPKLKPAAYTAEFVFDRISNGFKKMPAWKSVFTLQQRTALVAYVLSKEFSP